MGPCHAHGMQACMHTYIRTYPQSRYHPHLVLERRDSINTTKKERRQQPTKGTERKKKKRAPRSFVTLFLMEKLMKLVSTSTRKGGPSEVLYWKNIPVGTASLFCHELWVDRGSVVHPATRKRTSCLLSNLPKGTAVCYVLWVSSWVGVFMWVFVGVLMMMWVVFVL